MASIITHLLFILLVVILYRLLKDIDKSQAMLMVVFVSVGIAVELANLLNKFAPLLLLSGSAYLSAFTKPQLEALSLGFLRLHSAGVTLATIFWGLWLFPFGVLVVRSGFLPKILGVLLMIAGVGYLTGSISAIVFPAARQVVNQFVMPLYFGEVPIIFWLMIKGAKVRQPNASGSVSPR